MNKIKIYYYLYEIIINNPNSTLHEGRYYGKHSTTNLEDGYMGSGKLIKSYIAKYGLEGVTKNILEFFNNEEELNIAEYELIKKKQEELKDKCLNLNDGGNGSFSYINKITTPEQKKRKALSGGLGNKKRLENAKNLEEWKQKLIQRHANMSIEEKKEIYSKVSASLKSYYQNEFNKEKIEKWKEKNRQTNIEVSKRWRDEFKNLFRGYQPEAFRKYGKLQEAHNLFKQIKNLTKQEQEKLIEQFFNSL